MNTNIKRKYPYIVARNKPTKVEYYLTIKPNRRIYLQGISKNKIIGTERLNAYVEYVTKVSELENGHRSKPRLARVFYKEIFGEKTIATKIR